MLHRVPQPDVVLNRSSPVPLYFQVAEQLERAIHDGELVAGDRIANEVTWADQLGVSRPTMRQAIQLLVDKGMLVRKRGVGTQVVRAPIRRTVELTSLYDDLKRSGHQHLDRRPRARPGRGRRAHRHPPRRTGGCGRWGDSSGCATWTGSR